MMMRRIMMMIKLVEELWEEDSWGLGFVQGQGKV